MSCCLILAHAAGKDFLLLCCSMAEMEWLPFSKKEKNVS